MAVRKMRMPAKAADDCIAKAPESMQKQLRDPRRAIRGAAPEAKEAIPWRMPCQKYQVMLVFFAEFKNHMSFFPGSRSTAKEFEDKLKRFEVSGTTIHFTPENPLPAALVKQMVRVRMRKNEALGKSRRRGRQSLSGL